jgi:hypothetical protein
LSSSCSVTWNRYTSVSFWFHWFWAPGKAGIPFAYEFFAVTKSSSSPL